MFPVLMPGGIFGAHINPAMTLGQAIIGIFSWSQVLPYILPSLDVYFCYFTHYLVTNNPVPIPGTFCTTDASGSPVDYFVNEFFGLAPRCWSWESSAVCRGHGDLRGWLPPPSSSA